MESPRKLVQDCFLRPISDPRTTNVVQTPAPIKKEVKTELQTIRLCEESQKMTMDTLRSIYGENFELTDPSKYKDFGGRMKKSYWEDRGTLLVQGVTNFSALKHGGGSDDPNERLRHYALLKLQNYGFSLLHCIEAYDHFDGDTSDALKLLYQKYMRIPEEPDPPSEFYSEDLFSEETLLDIRSDEAAALESIYNDAFEEKEQNKIWTLKFKIDCLLAFCPSLKQKQKEEQKEAERKEQELREIELKRCRNFDRDGKCKYGSTCRFKHIREVETEVKKKPNVDENDNENWFFLEVHFPNGTKYPYEPPYIFLKTSCHDIPHEILLRISRRLYREAKENTREGMPCIYTISEMLQFEEAMSEYLTQDKEPFINPTKSLFDVDNDIIETPTEENESLPTHYERGSVYSANIQKDAERLERDDRKLVLNFLQNQSKDNYRKMMSGRQHLPAFKKMIEILGLIESSQVVVISGETGCGKSTQVPQFILDNWLFQSSKLQPDEKMRHVEVICTQPRRLSAIGVAERVAEERTERIGQIVGYQIRLENKISSNTRLTFCTTGILLRRLVSDPLLNSVTHIIVDEVHERSEESDFLLMILKRILTKRPDLKVILMSATLNANLFSEYFGGAPVLNIPGRTFPVEELFLEDILELCDFVMEPDSQFSRKIKKKDEEELMRDLECSDIRSMNTPPSTRIKDENLDLANIYARYATCSKKTCKTIFLMEPMRINPELIESVLSYVVSENNKWPQTGSILIFLPGLQEIQQIHDALCDSSLFGKRYGKFILVPLHSTLSSEEQTAVFRPAPNGKRKIVLCTNIAETSITIDDCVFVIDCGLMKEKRFDSNRNMESLDLVWVSRANALQRRGRAGRVLAGVCIHLFTSNHYHNIIQSQPVPEIHRVPLESLVLRIKMLPNFDEQNVMEVLGQTIEPPTDENIFAAINRLQDVGAIDINHELTPLGELLGSLPVDVRIGKLMLYGAIFQCLDSILTIAACLSHKSPFVSPFNKREEAEKRKREFAICNSDHLTCLMAYKKWLETQRRSYIAGRNFADEHFLSLKTLQTIADIKYQFLELLVSIGMVPIDVPRRRPNDDDRVLELTGHDLNQNGNNNRLLISLLCASLYPNIVKILTPEKSYIQTATGAMPKSLAAKDLRFKTYQDGYVNLHPSSVNYVTANYLSPFLLYQEKIKTSRIYIRECSMLPLVPFILFGGGSKLRLELHGGDFLFLIEDGWIIIKAHDHKTAEMIQCLRKELMKLLEAKIKEPCLNLLHHENGRRIIQNIIFLITKNN